MWCIITPKKGDGTHAETLQWISDRGEAPTGRLSSTQPPALPLVPEDLTGLLECIGEQRGQQNQRFLADKG